MRVNILHSNYWNSIIDRYNYIYTRSDYRDNSSYFLAFDFSADTFIIKECGHPLSHTNTRVSNFPVQDENEGSIRGFSAELIQPWRT